MEEKNLDLIILDMIKSYSNDNELGEKYRAFSLSYFGPFQDALIKTYSNDIELGKKLREIYSKKKLNHLLK